VAVRTPVVSADSLKLRVLAAWFDKRDDERDWRGQREVQADLRRMADAIELQELLGVW
jgi:hypothetical protein